MFTFSGNVKQLYTKYGWNYPIEVATNGYCIDIHFKKDKIKNSNNNESCKKMTINNQKKGLFEADSTKCNNKILDNYYKIGI